MTDDAAGLVTASRQPGSAGPISASTTYAWRVLLKIKHVPEELGDAIGVPILFTVLFTYLFGGGLQGSTHDYLQQLLPGTLVMAVVFLTIYSGVNINRDITTGAYDRFRSLPVWRPAPLIGALLGDIGRYLLATSLVLALGFLMGFSAEGGVAGVLAGVALAILFGLALSWAWIALGLVLRTPNAVMSLGFVVLMPVAFVSNVFVDPATLSPWLKTIAQANPLSHVVTAERALIHGTAAGGDVLQSLIAAAVLAVVFVPLSLRLQATHA